MIILGSRHSAASVLGQAYGHHRITDGNRKTMDATSSGAAATLAGWDLSALLCTALTTGHILGGDPEVAARHWIWGRPNVGRLLAATTQLDSISIPLHQIAMLADRARLKQGRWAGSPLSTRCQSQLADFLLCRIRSAALAL
ncbi:hypothetical protein WJX74_004788 [Apatococcus lobatus]|uniref:Uncharacterized protein n=1 Tax=Apatococcus lobatus TaxID=904363 RepID=A0AAW1QNG5_9CHLO